MRSSELRARHALPLAASVLSFACSTQPTATDAGLDCRGPGTPAAAEWRHSVERGPLFAIAAGAGIEDCSIEEKTGVIDLRYAFRDGGWLHAKRDPRIEYTEREVRFASPLAEDPLAVLRRAEQAAFGAAGCGIDWRLSETEAQGAASEAVFRGDVCNCQARVRREDGRVVGLTLRSAC